MTEHKIQLLNTGGQTLSEAFPEKDPLIKPFGSRILVQIRSSKAISDGGIHIPLDSRETEKWNTQVAKVVALGPVAFKNRDTLEAWPEDAWCAEGSFIRVPKYGGDRWEVPLSDTPNSEKVLFALFNDLDIIGGIEEEHVLRIIAFI